MKKIVFCLPFLWLAFVTPRAMAQEEIRFGLQSSPTFSWMNTPDVQVNRSGTNLGLRLAMMAEYYFRESYALTSGIGFHFNAGGQLLYEEAGTYWPKSDLNPGIDTLAAGAKLRYNLQYVEIPIGLKMRTREFGYFSYWLEPNLTFGFRSQARGNIDGRRFDGGTVGADGDQISIREEIGGLNLSWGLSSGLEYALSGTTALLAGLDLRFGFSDVTKNTGTYFDSTRNNEPRGEDSRAKIASLAIKLGILF